MKHLWLMLLLLMWAFHARSADTLSIFSPSRKIQVQVWMAKQLMYAISFDGRQILAPSIIDLEVAEAGALSMDNRIVRHTEKSVSAEIISPVPEKRKVIPEIYSQLILSFSRPYQVEFRAYDDGVAYRISTRFKDSIHIQKEVATFRFPGAPSAYFPQIHKRPDLDIFHTSFEELYPLKRLDSLDTQALAYPPVLLVPQGSGPKIGILESDLHNYPGMFLQGTGSGALKAVFAGYPLEEKVTEGEFPQAVVVKRAGYIARVKGNRDLPWRALIIAESDKALPSNDLVYRLASPSRIGNTDWINPGKGTDEWIININLFDVPFKAGLNTASYKYYIDFAKRFGFDRIMMDAGWSDNRNLFKINPNISMDTLTAYARQQGVKLSMWTLGLTLDRQLDSALDQFNHWGVDFIMTDFIDRNDQKAVEFIQRVAEACARHHIMIMYHGAYPPLGFNRTYPNALTREGVLGSEYNIWSDLVSPGHDVLLAFTRMLGGSMEYEPGILNNAAQGRFRAVEGDVSSQGTRAHQLALFIIYDSPLQLFSGNPSQGLREPDFMALLGSTPTTWDETRILEAEVGKYLITARKSGDHWYIGGITDWTPRDFTLSFDFLGEGSYSAHICKDGINADRYGADYVLEDIPVNKNSRLPIHLAPGGGFMIRLDKQ
jgi:alpha-glucosidase